MPFCLLRAGMENIPARSERAGRLCRISSVISSITAKKARPVGRALCLRFAKEPFLQVLLVALDHLFNHLAANRAGLAGGQIAVVALLEVDTDLPWCVFTTKTQFYFEVNTHQGGLMFFYLLKICYPCYIPYRVFCDFSNKAVKDTNTLPVGSSRPSNR